jgi:hypothetical protein
VQAVKKRDRRVDLFWRDTSKRIRGWHDWAMGEVRRAKWLGDRGELLTAADALSESLRSVVG